MKIGDQSTKVAFGRLYSSSKQWLTRLSVQSLSQSWVSGKKDVLVVQRRFCEWGERLGEKLVENVARKVGESKI